MYVSYSCGCGFGGGESQNLRHPAHNNQPIHGLDVLDDPVRVRRHLSGELHLQQHQGVEPCQPGVPAQQESDVQRLLHRRQSLGPDPEETRPGQEETRHGNLGQDGHESQRGRSRTSAESGQGRRV